MSGYYFVRKNSKGEVILRRDTNESLDFVKEYLDSKGIPYIVKEKARMLWIGYEERAYSYYYTTGRWAAFSTRGMPRKHYSSRGIEDFVTRFLIKCT